MGFPQDKLEGAQMNRAAQGQWTQETRDEKATWKSHAHFRSISAEKRKSDATLLSLNVPAKNNIVAPWEGNQ